MQTDISCAMATEAATKRKQRPSSPTRVEVLRPVYSIGRLVQHVSLSWKIMPSELSGRSSHTVQTSDSAPRCPRTCQAQRLPTSLPVASLGRNVKRHVCGSDSWTSRRFRSLCSSVGAEATVLESLFGFPCPSADSEGAEAVLRPSGSLCLPVGVETAEVSPCLCVAAEAALLVPPGL